jgi:sec-independent protein translocase protein TatA
MIGFIFNLGMTELLVILVILLLLFGARRLPELAKGLGQSIRSFKQGVSESQLLEDKREPTATTETKQMEMPQ